ncbi:MAG: hypothetical protein ACTSUD_05250, partial [Alphaproteobacteria bacterium]
MKFDVRTQHAAEKVKEKGIGPIMLHSHAMPTPQHRRRRALRYPYDAPDGSYTLRGGRVRPFAPEEIEGRLPVLAVGSNRSPERLRRKFGTGTDATVPVQKARLGDFDVVYSAHVTGYGAVPAMLQHHPGAEVEIAVTWLDAAQLEAMHATEGLGVNYDFGIVEGVRLTFDNGAELDSVHLYVGRRGHARVRAGEPGATALAAIACAGRGWPVKDVPEMLAWLGARIAPETP